MGIPDDVSASIREAAAGFSGVATVDVDGVRELEIAKGLAHRAYGVPITPSTRFGIASGSKTFTAIIALRLSERGELALSTPVREWLGEDLPLVSPEVTLEHLLTHTSGIGDYMDEDELDLSDYPLAGPVHSFTTAASFLDELSGHEQRTAPGEEFRYNNGGFAVAAIVLERVTGRTYAELVASEVTEPAGLQATDILRLDSLPGDVAFGYVSDTGDQHNLLHLPVLATGDGGAFTNADDMLLFWRALTDGTLLSSASLELMTTPRNYSEEEEMRYGLGLWLHPTGPALILEGCDIGQSFRSTHDVATNMTATVLSNTANGAWDMVGELGKLFD